MSIPIAPRHLKRYKAFVSLLLRHWDRKTSRLGDLDLDEENDASNGHSLSEDLEALGPTYVKLGQLLRTRPDILSASAYEDLGRLHDDVAPIEFSAVREVIESELGAKLESLFESFNESPVGAASLGQVHHATLRDGRSVAVKVQRPNAESTVNDDLDVLRDVSDFVADHTDLESRFGLCSTLREFRNTILAELDYVQEAENLERLSQILEPFDAIYVPGVVADYSKRHVLTMEFVPGTNLGNLNPISLLGKDYQGLARELFEAYLDQALLHGFVHSDPHPGNIILTDDERLALIDFGQVTVIPEDLRERILQLLLAVSGQDGSDAARIVERIGRPVDDYDGQGFRAELARLVAREGSKSVDQVRLGPLLVEVARLAGEKGLRIPSQLAVLGKTILNLEEVAAILDPAFDAVPVLKAYAPDLIAKQLANDLEPGTLFRKGLEAKRFAEALPSRLDALLETAAEGRFQVQMQINGEERIVSALTRMANRITSGLVLAALIVGASLLMRVETPFTIFGYPGVAMVLFILAAIGAVHLLIRIWRTADAHGP